MLSKVLQDSLNDQMAFETYSAYVYKAMESYFDSLDLKGFANFFSVQTQEELFHAGRFFSFICEAGGRALVGGMETPRNEYDSPLDAVSVALEHELEVTSRINKLSDLAIKESSHATRIFLDWFVNEQIEEEATFSALVSKLRMIEGDGRGLLMLDQELALRVFTPPAPV